jgi:hypothetical protein
VLLRLRAAPVQRGQELQRLQAELLLLDKLAAARVEFQQRVLSHLLLLRLPQLPVQSPARELLISPCDLLRLLKSILFSTFQCRRSH